MKGLPIDLLRHRAVSGNLGILAHVAQVVFVGLIYFVCAKAGLALASINPSATRDLAGALVVTPVLILWYNGDFRSMKARELVRSILVFAVAAFIGLIAFSPLIKPILNRGPLAFLAVLPLMWAALDRDQRDTATVA